LDFCTLTYSQTFRAAKTSVEVQPKFVHTQYLHMVAQSRPVIFNVGEIAPRERFYEPWGRFCGLGGLGGDFSLHRGDFCGLNCTKDLN